MTVTATSMKLKFPEFADIEDGTIEFAIEEAMSGGGDNWTNSKKYELAVMYLSAHLIAAGKVAADVMSGESTGDISSESIGRISVKYNKPDKTSASEATADELASSSYGRRYLEFVNLNFGGPIVV